MAITSNPTRTRTIESNWGREINKRWREFKKTVIPALIRLNAGDSILVINKGAVFDISASQQRTYMAFLQREINRLLLGTPEPPNWQAQYQAQAYQRGIESTRAALISQGAQIIPTGEEILAAVDLPTFTAIPSLGTGAAIGVRAPIHTDALEFLFTRSYESLNGWTDAMAKETRQILFDGVAQGKGIDEVVRDMTARMDVSRTRARVIARTETIQAFQRSTTLETERAGEEIGEEILLRWLTVKDGRVRHLHASWHGTLTTPKANLARINRSPWNCRCAQAPVISDANTEKKQKKFDKERKLLLAVERR